MIDIVVGGQYGSEGKGKVSYWLADKSDHKCVARIGGPNSGHTIKGKILRHLPAASLLDKGISIIGAGSYINVNILLKEIYKYQPYKLYIDSKAIIIDDKESEELRTAIGSTLSGTGTGVLDRIERINATYINCVPELQKYIVSTDDIHEIIKDGCILEGTQGFGLSVLHAKQAPFMTSRDTTASGFLSELGVSPKDVGKIYLIIRTYPIRVSGNSGPLEQETSWENLNLPVEYTSCTGNIRRVGFFEYEVVNRAIQYNKPDYIILNHLDYIPEELRENFIVKLNNNLKHPITHIGLNPENIQLI